MQDDISINYKVASTPEEKPRMHHFNAKCIQNYSANILTRERSVIPTLSEGWLPSLTNFELGKVWPNEAERCLSPAKYIKIIFYCYQIPNYMSSNPWRWLGIKEPKLTHQTGHKPPTVEGPARSLHLIYFRKRTFETWDLEALHIFCWIPLIHHE